MAKKAKLKETEKEIEKKETEMKQDEAKCETETEVEAEKKEDAADPEDHPDVAQDIELIKKLLDEYIGQESEMEKGEAETLKKLAKEAYEAYKEMGYSEEEAKTHAGHALKLAKHMAQKQSEQESEDETEDETETKQADDSADDAPKHDDKADAKGDDESEEEEEDESESESETETKESAKVKELEKKLLEAKAELAALKVDKAQSEVEKYVETKLAESKYPRAITKAFRETAGKIKSKEDFDAKWAIFSAGYERNRVKLDFGTVLTEKAAATDSMKPKTKKLDFSGCAE